jgi:hypothetical protein
MLYVNPGSFYPNPRLTEVVVSKIMIEGIHSTVTIYGSFAEKYIYSEEEIEEVPGLVIEDENEPGFTYNIASKLKVFAYHLFYITIMPFLILKETATNGKANAIRDSKIPDKKNENKVEAWEKPGKA